MVLKDFSPDPSVRDFVQCYRIVHFNFGNLSQIPCKWYPPKPEICLYFIIQGCLSIELNNTINNYRIPIVLGQQTCLNKRYLQKSYLNLQIVFQPAGFYRLTGISPAELNNELVEASHVFSQNILLIQDKLQHCKNYSGMILIADAFVTDLVRKTRKPFEQLDAISKMMIQSGGDINLRGMANQSFLCSKQFHRKFNERVGMNPKLYGRIIRFTKAYNTRNAFPDWDWLRIAVHCNYFDYQHLVRDYEEFTSLRPKQFHLLENSSPEALLGLSDDLYKSRI